MRGLNINSIGMGGLTSLPKRRGGAAPPAQTHDYLFHFEDAGSPCANSGTLGGDAPLTQFALSTEQYKFGAKSLLSNVNQVNSSTISVAPTTGCLRGSWTLEYWFRCASDGYELDLKFYKDALNQMIVTNYLTSGVYIWTKIAGSVRVNVLQAVAITANTWTHIAITYDGTTLRAFAAGIKIYEANKATTDFPDITNLYTFRLSAPSQVVGVYIDELAFSRTCKWTADFTPPTEAYSV